MSVYELEELDELIQSNWGIMPRGGVINEALGYFLAESNSSDFEMCKQRRVNVLLDPDRFQKLNECAKLHGVKRTDLIRYAIRKVVPMFANGEIVESF